MLLLKVGCFFLPLSVRMVTKYKLVCQPWDTKLSFSHNLVWQIELLSNFAIFISNILHLTHTIFFCFRVETQNEVGQHIHCYVAAVAAHTAFLEQPKSFRPSQWIKEHSERQSLNRNSLRRQNLTRDCHSRQVKHSSWAVHQPCPRQYNY